MIMKLTRTRWSLEEISFFNRAVAKHVNGMEKPDLALAIKHVAGLGGQGFRPRVLDKRQVESHLSRYLKDIVSHQTLDQHEKKEVQLAKASTEYEYDGDGRDLWSVDGLDGKYTVQELRTMLAERIKEVQYLQQELLVHREQVEVSVKFPQDSTPETIKFLPAIKKTMAAADLLFKQANKDSTKKTVVVAGVFNKHRDDIQKAFPKLNIRWIAEQESPNHMKNKVLGKTVIVNLEGTVNGEVIRTLSCFSRECHKGNGLSFVKKALASAHIY
jgi:hypothetical protein